jgi:AcrR family transcriptional regulator
MHLFSKKGFASTTVRDIARHSGITDAAIYYHFATKDELLKAILGTRFRCDHWIAKGTPHVNPGEVANDAVSGAMRTIQMNHELLRIILRESLAGNPVAACRYSQLLDDWESRLYSRLLPFESTGALLVGEAKIVARQITYSILMAFEDMLALRPDMAMTPVERRIQTLAFLSRHIGWLLPLSSNTLGEVPSAGEIPRRAL